MLSRRSTVKGEIEKRLLGKLAPGTMKYEMAGGLSPYALRPHDVAAAVSSIRRPGPGGIMLPDRPKQSLALYLWAGHDSVNDVEKVLRGIVLEASRILVIQNWKPKAGQLRGLATLVLLERASPEPCRACSASGWTSIGMTDKPCNACNGRGIHRWGYRRLAAYWQIDSRSWRRRWHERYRMMQMIVDHMESRGLHQIKMALRR